MAQKAGASATRVNSGRCWKRRSAKAACTWWWRRSTTAKTCACWCTGCIRNECRPVSCPMTGARRPTFRHPPTLCELRGLAAHPPPERSDVAREIGTQPACPCRDGRADHLSRRRTGSRSGQTGPKTVCRQLRDLPSQRARPRKRPLQPLALSVPATALREQFRLGLGAHLLSGVRRQCEGWTIARRRKAVAFHDRHVGVSPASAHAGAGAVEQDGPRPRLAHGDAAKSPRRGHLLDACRRTIKGCTRGVGVMTMEVDLQSKVEKYEAKAIRCEEQAGQAAEKAQKSFYEVLAGYYRSMATDYRKVIEKRKSA